MDGRDGFTDADPPPNHGWDEGEAEADFQVIVFD